ncbi:MAG: NAD+ synthase [Cyanobacteria bacterium HKST-UBA04]|nr:NAD+ synthase [Cyanobacteria bacterium HKST-UBA04]
MRIVLGQLTPTIGALDDNMAALTLTIEQAKAQGADLVVFSEMVVSGYPPKDLLLEPDFVQACLNANHELAKASDDGLMVIWGNLAQNPAQTDQPLLNAAMVAVGGQLTATIAKHHLPIYDVFNDRRYFASPHADAPEKLAIEALTVTHKGCRMVVTVCEDIWSHPALYGPVAKEHPEISPTTVQLVQKRPYPTNVLTQLPHHAFDLLVNLSASPFAGGKPPMRLALLSQIAQQQQKPVVYVNQAGAHDDVVYDGHSCLSWPNGAQWVANGFVQETSVVDLAPMPEPDAMPPPISITDAQYTLFEALTLGIRDYVQKTGFERVLVGLSGGVDSALVATLATEALGAQHVTGVAMPGPYSSAHSLTDARLLAKNLGIDLLEYPITEPFYSMLGSIGQAKGDLKQDLAEQNLQARLRGQLLMTLSNRNQALVLATGNKSELAVGYSTMYGDSCGALAPIGDLLKTEVYQLCRWLNAHLAADPQHPLIPETVLSKAPSAELAPNQRDSDTLPPYEVLDALIRAVVIDGLDFENCLGLGYDQATVEWVIRRIHTQEYKRQQYPPILKVSKKAFGSGRLYPLAQQVPLPGTLSPRSQ